MGRRTEQPHLLNQCKNKQKKEKKKKKKKKNIYVALYKYDISRPSSSTQ